MYVTTRVKHIAKSKPMKPDIPLNLTNSGTKPTPAATFFRQHFHMIGVHHYPEPG